MPNEIPAMNERAQMLLKALVERYIADGQPVGSRALSRVSGLDLSPASIRNVMADLEEMGFIASPHTSAGPIPRGLPLFVDIVSTAADYAKPPARGQLQPETRRAGVVSFPAVYPIRFAGIVMTPRAKG
jgi:heat-inducible transcriptional repressor